LNNVDRHLEIYMYVTGHSRSLEIAPFDKLHTSSC